MKSENTFLRPSLFFTLVFILVILTFYNSFYRLATLPQEYSAWIIIHAFSLLFWVLLLLIQPLFIYSNNFKRHKQFGFFSIGIVILIIVSTVFVALDNFEKNGGLLPAGKKYSILLSQLYSMLVFGFLYSMALLKAKVFIKHTQYLIGSTIIILGPVIFRSVYKAGLSFFYTVEFTSNVFTYFFLTVFLIGACLIQKRKNETFFPYLITVIALIPVEISQLWFSKP